MQQPNRGEIYNRLRAKQLRDFSGLLFGNITPTDIDGLIEFNNKCYVLIETKFKEATLPRGQELALERLTDDLNRVGKPTICIIASHENTNPADDIDVANTLVTAIRWKYKWEQKRYTGRTTKSVIDGFLNEYGKHKIKPI